jgi:hypothetical protein
MTTTVAMRLPQFITDGGIETHIIFNMGVDLPHFSAFPLNDSAVGAEKYVATIPQVFDLWQDPQERYDIFMTNWTEHTWTLVTISDEIKKLMQTYVQYPPRKLQSASYSGPIEITKYQNFQWVRDQRAKEGVNIPMPTGN